MSSNDELARPVTLSAAMIGGDVFPRRRISAREEPSDPGQITRSGLFAAASGCTSAARSFLKPVAKVAQPVLIPFRTGDIPAKGLSALTNLAAKKIPIGDVTFGVSGIAFEPSKRNVSGAATFNAGKAKSIKTSFTVKTAIKVGSLQALPISDKVVVSLSDSTKLSATAALGLEDSKPAYDMVMKISHKHDAFNVDLLANTSGIGIEQTIGTRAKAGVDFDSSRVLGGGSRTSIEATATMATTPSGRGSGSIQFGLSGTF